MAYQFARNGRSYSERMKLSRVLRRSREALKRVGGPYSIGLNGPTHGLLGIITRLAYRLPKLASGEVLHLWARRNAKPVGFLIKRVGVIEHKPLLSYTGSVVNLDMGNERIREIVQWAADRYPGVRCNGWSYKRLVSGSSTWSQHSPLPPKPGYCNAADLTFYVNNKPSEGSDTLSLGVFVADLLHEARRGNLPVGKIIYQDTVYNAPDFRAANYDGPVHSTHTHVEGYPKQTGEPV